METTPHFGGASVEPVLSFEKLAESEHRFRKLVEALPDAILVHSENKIVFVNPFCVRLHGAETAEQLLGRDISEFIKPEFLPAIQQRVEECYLNRKLRPLASRDNPHHLRRFAGRHRSRRHPHFLEWSAGH